MKVKTSMSRLRVNALFPFFLLLSIALSACGGAEFIPSGWSGLDVDQDTAFIAYNQYVFAIRVSDGKQVWRHPAGDPEKNKTFYASPALTEDGQVVVGGYNNTLYSLSRTDGTEQWNFPAKDRFIASPLAVGEQIFAPNADGNLYALDLDGNLLWSFNAGSPLWAEPVTDDQCLCVYLATMGHQLYSLDAKTGEPNWGPVNLGSALVGKPALSEEGVLYIGTFGKEMVAIRAESGEILWRVPTDGWVWAGPAVGGDRLYFGDIAGNFYVLNIPDRTYVKKSQPGGTITSTPWIAEDAVYFTTESGTINAVDLDGNPLWNETVGGQIHTSPVVSNDVILVAPIQTDPVLVAVNDGGTQKWAFAPEK
jgi:outer membrane protein assembly factor BamB